jgi:DNA-binding CsgD family transcriptional regulator
MARRSYEQSLAILRELGDRREVAASLLNLAIVARDQHDRLRATRLVHESMEHLIELGDRAATATCLELLASIAAQSGQADQAAQLYGAADVVAESAGARVPTLDPVGYASAVDGMQARLGMADYARARAAGRALSVHEAAAMALAIESNIHDKAATGTESQLTRREMEVAALVARGLTNRQIAERLVIAPGTAALHVEHLRQKLGARSRAQVAAWAVEHGVAATT